MANKLNLLKNYSIFLFFCVLLGCDSGNEPQPKTVVHALAYGSDTGVEGISWIRIVNEFEALNPDVDIVYEMAELDAYHQLVDNRIASGDIPDIAFMGPGTLWGKSWQEAGECYDHRPLIDQDYFDMNLITGIGPNGEVWEIPQGVANIASVLYMNKLLVESLGFTVPTTYEDIVGMVQTARSAHLEVITIDGADAWAWSSCLLSSVIARFSGDPHWISDALAGTNRFTDKAFVDSLAFVRRMVSDGVISEVVFTRDYGANIEKYNNGEALFMIQGQWATKTLSANMDENTLLLALPGLPGETFSGSTAGAAVVGYGITKNGTSDPIIRNAAWKFLCFYHSIPETTKRLREGSIIAPILKDYDFPIDLPSVIRKKADLCRNTGLTEIIDAYLPKLLNDTLNAGIQDVFAGMRTPENLAAEVEALARQ